MPKKNINFSWKKLSFLIFALFNSNANADNFSIIGEIPSNLKSEKDFYIQYDLSKKAFPIGIPYKNKYPNGLISLILICPIVNKKMWTLYIGNNSLATYTFAVNRAYYEAIKIANENNCEFLDLFGTCGDPGTKEKNYNGIHEYKRKMGGTYTEFVGEYDIVNKPFINKMLPIMLKIYRKLRRR